MGYTAALVVPTKRSRPPAHAVRGTTAFVYATSQATIPRLPGYLLPPWCGMVWYGMVDVCADTWRPKRPGPGIKKFVQLKKNFFNQFVSKERVSWRATSKLQCDAGPSTAGRRSLARQTSFKSRKAKQSPLPTLPTTKRRCSTLVSQLAFTGDFGKRARTQ